jgi:plasmid replication initiation protein
MLEISKINGNNYIKKSNKLIEGRTRLTTNEQKIILILASQIKKNDTDFRKYSFSYDQLNKVIGFGSDNYTYLENLTKGLIGKVVEITELNEKGKKIKKQFAWLSSAVYREGEGIVELGFSDEMRPYLLELGEQFKAYQLRNILALSSGHAIRLYELLKQYENIGYRMWELTEFKLDLGLKTDTYPVYYDFKRRVLLPAQKELKKSTDIKFTFEEIKTGRKITDLKFYIKPQVQHVTSKEAEIDDFLEPTEPDEIDAVLRKYNIIIGHTAWVKTAETLKMNFTLEQIGKIAVVLARKTKDGIIKNAAGMLVADPIGIGRSILDGTFYNSDKKSDSSAAGDDYEIYVPPQRY